jgi:endonuclease/exonuclease/phosphatase family metal-dependent hydrolase
LASEPIVLRVATFNARHGARPHHLTSNRALVETCRALDADVLALQELDRYVIRSWFRNQPELLARFLWRRAATAPAKWTPIGGQQCNALLTRGDLHDVEVVALPRRPGDERRVALLARVQLPGVELSVACTHLQHRVPDAAVEQLHAVLELLSARPGPHLLAGDLNLDPAHVEPLLAQFGFAAGDGGPTSPAANPRRRIDWLACDAGLRVSATRVHAPLVSDHCPVVADLVVD